MNICFVSTLGVECGIASYTMALAQALKRAGHSVSVLAEIKDKQPLHEVIDGIDAYRIWWRGTHHKTMFGLSSILRAIDSSPQKPDVVHFQHEFGLFPDNAGFLNLISGLRERGVRPVITFHTVLAAPGGVGFFARFSDEHIIVHTAEALAALSTQPGGRSRVFVVPHGLTIGAAKETDHSIRTIQFLVPGFISKNKGHLEIIEGFAQYLSTNNDSAAVLKIMGLCRDEWFLGQIKNEIAKSCLEDRIELKLGYHSDAELFKAFAETDYVILGAGESTPYSASGQLAMCIAHAVPVLAKNVPIYRSGGDCGVIYYEEDCLAPLLGAFEYDENLTNTLRAKHLAVRETRTWDIVAKQHLEIYGN